MFRLSWHYPYPAEPCRSACHSPDPPHWEDHLASSKKSPRKATKPGNLKPKSVRVSVAARLQGGQTISGQGSGDPIPTESLRVKVR